MSEETQETTAAQPAQRVRGWCEDSLVLALQYCQKDEKQALQLAVLLATLEQDRRGDCVLALCRSADCELSDSAKAAASFCQKKFPAVMVIQATTPATGHPEAPNRQWVDFMDIFAGERSAGRLQADSVFTFEPDGVPLSRDWIDRLMHHHRLTMDAGKFVTAGIMHQHLDGFDHPNGNLIMSLPFFLDHPSLRYCPPDRPWDMYHRRTLMAHARPSNVIATHHLSTGWSAELLKNLSNQSAWLHGFRDHAPLEYAYLLAAGGAQ